MDRDRVEIHKLAKKRTSPLSSHLDRNSLVNVSYTKITFHMITDKTLALKEAIVTNNNIKLYLVSVCFIEIFTYHIFKKLVLLHKLL